MKQKLVIDGNAVYEIDEDCLRKKENRERDAEQKKREDGCPGRKNGK